ncbi:MAG: hypothetical protein AABX30_02720 [Nanoarchaeota archaeon]
MKKRLLRNVLAGILSFSTILGCSSIEKQRKFDPYQEIFRADTQKNKDALDFQKIEIDYEKHDAQNQRVVVNDRTYLKEEQRPATALEEVINATPNTIFKVPLINAEYIENATGGLVLLYKCRVSPKELIELVEPHLSDIEMHEFPQRNMVVFSGPREKFGDFSYFSTLLNQMDIPAEQIRIKIKLLEFFGDNTYDRENILDILRDGKSILGLNLPSSSDGKSLTMGVYGNPLYSLDNQRYEFNSIVKFLDSRGHVEILADLDLLASNGQEVKMSNMSSIPFPQFVFVKDNLIKTVEYKKTGVQFIGKAHRNDDGYINLEINEMESGEQTGYTATEQIPIFRDANLSSNYVLQEGETYFALDSLFSRYKDVTRGVPGLNKIPLIKDLTSSKSYENNRSQLILLINARGIPREDLTGRLKD